MAGQEINTSEEVWKAIPDYPGYEVSDQGRVRSYRPTGRGIKFSDHPKILKPRCYKGYPEVNLHKDGKKSTHRIHKLVLTTFVGPCPDGMESCHNDGTRDNNILANLRWDTLSNNQLDRHQHGTINNFQGANSPVAKLTNSQVIQIREMHSQGYGYRRIAKLFPVDRNTIRHIVLRKAWTNI